MNDKAKHHKALIILSALIVLSLLSIIIINKLGGESETVLEIMKDHYTIYVSGLAALFIILFQVYFRAYRKILSLLTVVAMLMLFSPSLVNNMGQGEKTHEDVEDPTLPLDSTATDSTKVELDSIR